MRNTLIHVALLEAFFVPAAHSQTSQSPARKYSPIEEYLMPEANP
jgi:hypothetical protein